MIYLPARPPLRFVLPTLIGIALLGAAACAGGCGATSASPPPNPGDAGQADARADGGPRDAALDRNEVLPDGSSDWSWLPGEWGAVPGIPNFCEVRMAVQPARDVPPLQWKECASGRAGCRTLVPDWDPGPFSRQALSLTEEPMLWSATGAPWLRYVRWYPDGSGSRDRDMRIVYRKDGTAAFALANDLRAFGRELPSQRCLGQPSFDGATTLTRVSLFREDVDIFSTFPVGTTSPNHTSREIADKEQNGGGSYFVHQGNTAYIFTQVTGGFALLDIPTDRVTLPSDRNVTLQRPTKNGAVVLRYATYLALDFLRPDGSMTRLVNGEPGRHVSGYAIDRATNESLAWVEADTVGPATNTVMWASPPAESLATLQRRRVTAFDDPGGNGGSYMIANGGYALTLVSKTRALLVRLSDGWSWPIDAEPKMLFLKPVWVDDEDVWIASGSNYTANPSIIDEDSILRVTRASLGAPTIAPR